MLNILVINHYAGSNKYGMEYRPYYMAREWRRLGHSVRIVAASYSHVRSFQPALHRAVLKEDIDGISYVWLRTPSYRGNNLGRVLNIFMFVLGLWRYSRLIIDDFKPDVVISSSTYPLDIYPAKQIAHRAHAKLIHEVHDLWPLSPIELGGLSRYNPFILLMGAAEKYAYRVADSVISMLPLAVGHMESKGMSPDKFVYIPNGVIVDEWVDSEAVLPSQHIDTVREIKASGRYVVGYAGSHGLANSLHVLIKTASILKDNAVSFVLVGSGLEKESLQRQAAALGLTNIHFLPNVPKSSMPHLLGLMDVLYIGLKKQPLFRFGISPNKLMDYMMAAKPIVQAIDTGNDMIGESGCGISVAADDHYSIGRAIMNILNMSAAEREQMGQRGKSYVLANHDYKALAKRFLSVMQL